MKPKTIVIVGVGVVVAGVIAWLVLSNSSSGPAIETPEQIASKAATPQTQAQQGTLFQKTASSSAARKAVGGSSLK